MDALVSYHEAGHSTVAFLLGSMPEEVTISPDGDSSGHMSYLPVEARIITESAMFGRTQADRSRVMKFLVTNAAGAAAQALYQRGTRGGLFDQVGWEVFDGKQDYERTVSIMHTARGLLHAKLDDIVSEAFDLLEQPGVWASVEQVAGDLLRFGELDYTGIRDAVMFNDLIGVKPKQVSPRIEKLRKTGWSESEIGTGRRVLSREEAERAIKAKSPFGWSRVGWNKDMERR
jgi:hypothetical protein